MKTAILAFLLLFTIKTAYCQLGAANGFICQLKQGYQGIGQKDITAIISKVQLENFRLLDQRDTLTFDNGFDIILLSAKELHQSGIITDLTSYLQVFPPNYKLPVFHLNEQGQIAAAYPVSNNVKYSVKKRKM